MGATGGDPGQHIPQGTGRVCTAGARFPGQDPPVDVGVSAAATPVPRVGRGQAPTSFQTWAPRVMVHRGVHSGGSEGASASTCHRMGGGPDAAGSS